MSKLEVCKSALEQQENQYEALVKEALEALREEVINSRQRCISDEMLAETVEQLTTSKILAKGAKVLKAKKKFNEEKSRQVPTIYPKPLMEAVERGEIENLTKYPYCKKVDGMKFRLTGFTSKSLLFSWTEKEGLSASYEINYHKKSKEPLEIFKRIKKEMESEKND